MVPHEQDAVPALVEEGAAVPAPPERPSDASVLQQQNDIRAESASVPYVGCLEPLEDLKAEYAGSETFRSKIDGLLSTYSHLRRTRGDGNCFFRAFLFGYLDSLLQTGNKQECSRMLACLQGWHKKLIDAGFQELVFEDAMALLLQQVNGIMNGNIGQEALEGAFRDDLVSNTMVFLLRIITSAEIQRREDFFLPFIMGMFDEPVSVQVYCQRRVEPMAEESEETDIVAITDALMVPCTVVYLDSRGGCAADQCGEANVHHFVPGALAVTAPAPPLPMPPPAPVLLYRPGHYELLTARPL